MVLVKVGGGGSSINYGDGRDGSVTWSSNSTKSGIYQTTDLTITSGTSISVGSDTGGLVIFAQDSITVEGNASINASGVGVGGGGGGSGVGIGNYRSCEYGSSGGAGKDAALIGPGGDGGRNSANGGTAFGGTFPAESIEEHFYLGYIMGAAKNSGINIAASGAGGQGGSVASGGSGGNGGGCVALVSPNITVDNTASIDVSGQDGAKGGDAALGDESGGSGGGGGAGGIFLAYGQSPNVDSSSIDASGGSGGAGGAGGFDCSGGSSGGSGASGEIKIMASN